MSVLSLQLGRHSKNQGDAATNKPKDGKAKELASGDKHKKSKDDDKKKDSIIGSKDRDQKKDHKVLDQYCLKCDSNLHSIAQRYTLVMQNAF
ncbi:hypothetical protein Tcan_02128 [Toxocara canis]|uniref:Uncharacterized protein n=1 Tax=Toxocara canis TaxID=6265 RepID=A0A0B2URY0_TOXCA|nr:hypothetical protein Tcan_02128 [Toxocara canis]